MRLLTRNSQKELDNYLVSQGFPLLLLMETAGRALARHIAQQAHKLGKNSIDFLIGPGMNGGDLYVAARVLAAEGFSCQIYESSRNQALSIESDSPVGSMRSAVLAVGLSPLTLNDYKVESLLVVDGLLGTGFQVERALSEELAFAFRQLRKAKAAGAYLIACDLPSGIEATTGQVADFVVAVDQTVTFIAPKLGQVSSPALSYNGELQIESLGISNETVENFFAQSSRDEKSPFQGYYRLDNEEFFQNLLPINSDTHKYRQGSLALVAGSTGMSGSLYFAGKAAVLSGIGLLHIVTGREVYQDVFPHLPQALYHIPSEAKVEAWQAAISAAIHKADALAIGPGLGQSEGAAKLVASCLELNLPLLLDADALNLLAKEKALRQILLDRQKKGRATLLTPHAGEAQRLAQVSMDPATWKQLSRLEQATYLSKNYSCYLILKGESSLIADPYGSALYVNPTGGPGLAKGASGDILTGLVAGLLAQKPDPLQAAVLGTYWHGRAGDLASANLGWRCHTPQETLDYLSTALYQLPN
ncbi:MAG: NAD(P)H-hydrate dehydratase [Eubacteriales bacterium]|nr:NAD(P)H-hydrate dehydratase [Eubacteriales bacterium]